MNGRIDSTDLKVGLFVASGVALVMASILLLGGASELFTRSNRYFTYFPSVEGLISGSKVMLSGIHVGEVQRVTFHPERRQILVELQIKRSAAEWIRKDTQAEISTQGLLGDKYLSLNMGSPETEAIESGSEIPSHAARDLSQFVSKGDELVGTVSRLAATMDRILKTFENGNRSEVFFQNLAQSSKNLTALTARLNQELEQARLRGSLQSLESILRKIDSGDGTLGALVNDPALYQDLKNLTGGVNRNRVVRNLVRQAIQDGESRSTPPNSKAP